MSRVHTLFVTIVPSAIAGGLLFASAFGHAEAGRDGALGFWPTASDTTTGSVMVAQADPRPMPRPRGPMPPLPPVPPAPPVPPPPGHGHRGHRGVSVSIHDGKVQVDGIAELVQDQLESVATMLDHMPDVPPDVRDRVKARIKAVRERINARLGKLRSMDVDRLDKLGPEMERMGDEIEREMEGLDKDLAQLGEKIGQNFARKFGKDFGKSFGPSVNINLGRDKDDADDDDDDDDRDAVTLPPSADTDFDPSNLGPAIAALRDLSLDPGQKQQLAQLRADSDRQVAGARRELEQMSSRLHDALLDDAASEADIARQIESISAKEATIRKARILGWIKARNMLRKDQRQKIEAAVKKAH